MPNISVRGIDPAALAELKALAARENASVNALVLRLIDQGLGRRPDKRAKKRHDDLDALAGCWSAKEAAEFADATAAFEEVDPRLWK